MIFLFPRGSVVEYILSWSVWLIRVLLTICTELDFYPSNTNSSITSSRGGETELKRKRAKKIIAVTANMTPARKTCV